MKKLLLLYSIMPFFLSAVDIGSDTAVSRFNNVVTINNNDRVAGFAALYGGFTFADAITTGLFDSFFPVSGSIAINGGNLVLDRDLILHDVLTVGALGNIYGNRHVMEMPVIDVLPTNTGPMFSCAPYFASSINVGQDAETLSWNFDEQFLLTASDDGIIRLYEVINNLLTFRTSIGTGGAATDGVGQVAWRQSGYIFALAREGGSAGNPSVRTFSYNVGTNTITQIDTSGALGADARACAWHPSGNFLAVGTAINATEIIIYPVSGTGDIDLAGAVTFNIAPDRDVYYECVAWDTSGSYLAVGLESVGGNPELIVLRVNTSPLAIVGINASTVIGKSVVGLDWGKGANYIAVGLEGTTGDNIRVYSHNPGSGGVGAGTLTQLASVSNLARTTEGISWQPDGTCFSASTDESGGTAFFNTYSFNGSVLTLISNFIFTGLAAGDDFEATRWGPMGRFAAVSGDDNIIRTYGLPSGSCYIWSNLIIQQASNTLYHDLCITFTGNNIWTGRGCFVEFESTCTLYIAANSSLMFRDMSLLGLDHNRIIPLDSTSTLSFNNMSIFLDGDYTFSFGRLDIIDDVLVQGEGRSFIFSATVAGHIHSNSRFIFDTDTIFRYEPNNNSRTNFVFDDNTAQLVLQTATLSTSPVGLQLTKGKIMFDGLCMLVNEGNSSGTSLQLGDGSIAANNVVVRWLPACNVELMQGILRNNNV